jgi:hypothetical protein
MTNEEIKRDKQRKESMWRTLKETDSEKQTKPYNKTDHKVKHESTGCNLNKSVWKIGNPEEIKNRIAQGKEVRWVQKNGVWKSEYKKEQTTGQRANTRKMEHSGRKKDWNIGTYRDVQDSMERGQDVRWIQSNGLDCMYKKEPATEPRIAELRKENSRSTNNGMQEQWAEVQPLERTRIKEPHDKNIKIHPSPHCKACWTEKKTRWEARHKELEEKFLEEEMADILAFITIEPGKEPMGENKDDSNEAMQEAMRRLKIQLTIQKTKEERKKNKHWNPQNLDNKTYYNFQEEDEPPRTNWRAKCSICSITIDNENKSPHSFRCMKCWRMQFSALFRKAGMNRPNCCNGNFTKCPPCAATGARQGESTGCLIFTNSMDQMQNKEGEQK